MSYELSLFSLDFTGIVTQIEIDDNFPDRQAFSENDSFRGTITYDLNSKNRYAGSDQYPFTAKYDMNSSDDYYGITTIINDFVFQTHPGDVLIQNDHPEYKDELRFHAEIFENPGVGAKLAKFPFDLNSSCSINWELKDSAAEANNDLKLPENINLDNWRDNNFRIRGVYRENYEDVHWLRIYGKIDKVSSQTKPKTTPSAPINFHLKE
jgi:hypothetical protein